MGELIKKVSEIKIGNGTFAVELNESTNDSGYKDIHIQNDKFRLSVPENEFLQMAACVLLAQRQLELIKGKCED